MPEPVAPARVLLTIELTPAAAKRIMAEHHAEDRWSKFLQEVTRVLKQDQPCDQQMRELCNGLHFHFKEHP